MPHAGDAGLLLNGVTFIQKSFRPPVSNVDAHWDASSAKTGDRAEISASLSPPLGNGRHFPKPGAVLHVYF